LAINVPAPAFAHLKRVYSAAHSKKLAQADAPTTGGSAGRKRKAQHDASATATGEAAAQPDKSSDASATSAAPSISAASSSTATEAAPAVAAASSAARTAPLSAESRFTSELPPSPPGPHVLVLLCAEEEWEALSETGQQAKRCYRNGDRRTLISMLSVRAGCSLISRVGRASAAFAPAFAFFLFAVRAGLEIFRLTPFVKGVPNQLPRDAEEAAMARAHWPVSLHTPATGAATSGAAAGGVADCAPLDADGVPVFAAADRLKFGALWRVALEQARLGAEAGQLPRGAVVVRDRHMHDARGVAVRTDARECGSSALRNVFYCFFPLRLLSVRPAYAGGGCSGARSSPPRAFAHCRLSGRQ
jgi:hypothetical protein